MFRQGRRLYSSAAVTLLVIAALHTLGHFSGPGTDPERLRIEASLAAFRIDMGLGMRPSLADIRDALSLMMTIMCAGFGGLLLTLAATAAWRPLRASAFAAAVTVGALLALFACYRIMPPLVTLAVTEVLLLAWLATARPDAEIVA